MPIKDAKESASYWDNGNYFPINSQIALNKPEKYKENMCIETWLDQVESFLQPFDKKIWAAITSTYLNESCYKTIRNIKEIKQSEDGFSSLKNQLIDLYAPKKSNNTEKKIAIGQLLNRKQNEYEQVSDFVCDLT